MDIGVVIWLLIGLVLSIAFKFAIGYERLRWIFVFILSLLGPFVLFLFIADMI